MFSHELAWKTLKDGKRWRQRLDGFAAFLATTARPRDALRARCGRLRAVTGGLTDGRRAAIVAVLAANERVERAVLFGSRATGTHAPPRTWTSRFSATA